MGISFWQILVVVLLLVVLFGRGKISSLMGDMAKGIKSFKRGMAEDDTAAAQQNTIDATADKAAPVESKDKETA
ncbi:MAG: twin-arginine translocase TatA/TatE family subunit [Alphaproteobacteria bacterium]|jgi:sec-independent protein translocase protein TatA